MTWLRRWWASLARWHVTVRITKRERVDWTDEATGPLRW